MSRAGMLADRLVRLAGELGVEGIGAVPIGSFPDWSRECEESERLGFDCSDWQGLTPDPLSLLPGARSLVAGFLVCRLTRLHTPDPAWLDTPSVQIIRSVTARRAALGRLPPTTRFQDRGDSTYPGKGGGGRHRAGPVSSQRDGWAGLVKHGDSAVCSDHGG